MQRVTVANSIYAKSDTLRDNIVCLVLSSGRKLLKFLITDEAYLSKKKVLNLVAFPFKQSQDNMHFLQIAIMLLAV